MITIIQIGACALIGANKYLDIVIVNVINKIIA